MSPVPTIQSSTFRNIREKNKFYADKTAYLYQLIRDYKAAILCRPWGFGKTLLLDSLTELFQGNRDLFANLWIDSSDYKFEKHPVIRLSLAYEPVLSSDHLNQKIFGDLQIIAQTSGLTERLDPATPLTDLVLALIRQFNPLAADSDLINPSPESDLVKVAILIDDFDSPVLKALDDENLAASIQQTLGALRQTIEDLSPYCRFSLLAGQTNLGCGETDPNDGLFEDISFLTEYAEICGFNSNDLDQLVADNYKIVTPGLYAKNQFRPGQMLDELKQLITLWYNGYYFDGQTLFDQNSLDKVVKVFNPYDILTFFDRKSFENHWIQAHEDKFLTKLVAEKPDRFISYDFSGYSRLTLVNFKNPPLGLLLFQLGYLTLKESSLSHGLMSYNFKVPNLEISLSFRKALLEILFNLTASDDIQAIQSNIQKALTSHNQFELEEAFALSVARLTYRPPRPDDFYYRMVFQLFIYCLGFDSSPDDPPGLNRLELVKQTFAGLI
ncbi:MAG: AAA family ATPase [Deltaproteobacteria bacterium]|jgi:hypothetical protein|nr:AAA family ATPase [Deltaproteobacteria bacterium]